MFFVQYMSSQDVPRTCDLSQLKQLPRYIFIAHAGRRLYLIITLIQTNAGGN